MPIASIRSYIRGYLRERRRDKVVGRAIDLDQAGKYVEAAEIYAAFAVESLAESELMASLYHQYAFEMWLKANDPQNALDQARHALRMLCTPDGKWLTYNSGENAEKVIVMVSQLYAAGHTAEGQHLASEANEQFEIFGLPVRCAAAPVRRSEFPPACPQCAGTLPNSPFHASITCPFCKSVIYAEL